MNESETCIRCPKSAINDYTTSNIYNIYTYPDRKVKLNIILHIGKESCLRIGWTI